jgi:hypothetical protein
LNQRGRVVMRIPPSRRPPALGLQEYFPCRVSQNSQTPRGGVSPELGA